MLHPPAARKRQCSPPCPVERRRPPGQHARSTRFPPALLAIGTWNCSTRKTSYYAESYFCSTATPGGVRRVAPSLARRVMPSVASCGTDPRPRPVSRAGRLMGARPRSARGEQREGREKEHRRRLRGDSHEYFGPVVVLHKPEQPRLLAHEQCKERARGDPSTTRGCDSECD